MINTVPHYDARGDLKSVDVTVDKQSISAFIKLVNRALNTWDDAPPELKELGDQLTHGKVLQSYR